MAETILSCPFCGGDATLNHGATDDYDVVCRNRKCFGPRTSACAFSSDAIAMWNTRALRSATPMPEPVAWRYTSRANGEEWPWTYTEHRPVVSGFTVAEPLFTTPPAREISEAEVERAAREFLLHQGEQPSRITKRGAELWEDYAPAMRAALEAARSPS